MDERVNDGFIMMGSVIQLFETPDVEFDRMLVVRSIEAQL
jgi:hypothetical protein